MPQVIPWPELRARDVSFFLRWTTRSAGRNLAGYEQTITANLGQWEITVSLGTEFDGDALRDYEGLIAQMEGRRNIAVLSLCDALRYGGSTGVQSYQPFSDGTFFTDGTGFLGTMIVSSVVVTASVPAGAMALQVAASFAPMRRGDLFSHDDFLYRVTSADSAGNVAFTPPLRRDIPMNAELETDPARIQVRFATDDEGRRSRELLRWGEPVTLRFVEAFDRPAVTGPGPGPGVIDRAGVISW